MKHLATIQTEFLKESRNWNNLSVNEQWAYLRDHPKSKKKLTAAPKAVKDKVKKLIESGAEDADSYERLLKEVKP
jgi:hypothetical protein